MTCLAEMGLKVLIRAEWLLALKPGKGACPMPAAAKAWKVVANDEVCCRDLNANYPNSIDLL
jgi:hypothetical protein